MIDCYRFQCHNRLLGIKPDTRVSSTHRFSATYTYFANGNINVAQFRQPNSPHSHKRYRYTHTYDNRNQLTGADYNYLSGSTWTNSSEFDLSGLSYDKNGNITAMSRRYEGLKTYSYNYATGTNRLSTVNKNGTNISFGYDGNGNVKTIGSGYSITNTVYNWRNLPTSITKSGTTYGYRYDHDGMRVYKQEGDNIHTLRGAFGEVIATYKNGSLDYWNIVKPNGSVIGRREGSNRLYYHRDHLGSIRAVVNASGSVVQTYDYYPFGLEMPGRSLTSGPTSRERFTGHERDEEVGLDYMQARRYTAEFGRLLSVDPLGGDYPGISLYAYALNNPINLIDPTGMCPEKYNDQGQLNCVDGGVYKEEDFGEVTVTASSLNGKRASSYTYNGTFYFNASSSQGKSELYSFLRQNSSMTAHILTSSSFSSQAKSIAMTASIHNAGATFLRISMSTGADVASLVSMASGAGTVAGVGVLLLRRSAMHYASRNSVISIVSNSSRMGLYSSSTEAGLITGTIPFGGSSEMAGRAILRAGTTAILSQSSVLGVSATGLPTSFRNISNGQFVTNSSGIARFSISQASAASPSLILIDK